MNNIKYRPDIDGLRAIAVLSVIGFHAFPAAFQGGFVGVDIFFVISGFLISTIIFGNLEKKNFSYKEFYARRIKRIFPALLLVMTANLLFGWFVLFPGELKQLGKHIAGGNAFISNFILWNEAGYFDNSSETKPLLHLWSLGIEEQYYFFWPLLLGLVWKYKLNFLTTVVFIAVISFAANIYTLHAFSAVSAFYLPINRFWELMIGGVLAYLVFHKKRGKEENRFFQNFQPFLGCGLLVTGLIFINEDQAFPGWWALLPTLGTFFIISTPESWINRHILGNRILVYLGLISYPLYLWHWSFLSFSHILEKTSSGAKAGSIAASFILAWLTYEFLEKKIRTFKGYKAVTGLIIFSFLLIFLGLALALGTLPPRNNTPGVNLAAEAVGDWEYPGGLEPAVIDDVNVYLKLSAEGKVLFYGDSHLEQYAPKIIQLIKQDPSRTKSAVFATRGGCPPIPNVFEDHHLSCSRSFKEKILNYALSPAIDSVVIGTFWGYLVKKPKLQPGKYRYYYLHNGVKKYYDEDGATYALQALEDMLTEISRVKKVFLLIDNPTGSSFDPKSFFSGTRITGVIDKRVYFQKYQEKQKEVRAKLMKIARRSNAIIIDPVKHFCQGDQCRTALDNGTPIYKDSGHIRPFYMRAFVDYFDVTVNK